MGAIVALLLLAAVALRATAIVALMQSDADLAAPLVMAEEAHRYVDAELVTGRLGWWGGLWFLQLIRPLPGNSYIGSYLPLLVTVAVAFLVGQQARRLWGPAARWVVLIVALGVGAEVWANFAAWSSRAPSWWTMGLLGLASVAAARADARRGPLLVLIGGACALAAIASSGDQLAVVPLVAMAAAGAYALRIGRRRLGVGLIGLAVATVAAGRLVAFLAERAGYIRVEFPFGITPFSDLGATFANLTVAGQTLWRGAQGVSGTEGTASTLGSAAGYLGFLLVCVAVVAIVRAAIRGWRTITDDERHDVDGLDQQRAIWVTFWAVCVVAYLLAFLLTDASGPLGQPVVRYLYGIPLATAATLAPLAGRGRAAPLLAAVGLLGVLTAASLVLHRPTPTRTAVPGLATPAVLGRIGQVVASEHLTRGYAGYWQSYPLVLHSGYALDVTPLGMCTTNDGLCRMYLHYIDKAYVPRPGVRTFLVVDRSPYAQGQWRNAFVTGLPPGIVPEKVVPVGDDVEVAIFPYDLATRLSSNKE